MQNSAKNVLAMGGALSLQGKAELYRMDEAYIKRNISSGGCADLLSVAIMLNLLDGFI